VIPARSSRSAGGLTVAAGVEGALPTAFAGMVAERGGVPRALKVVLQTAGRRPPCRQTASSGSSAQFMGCSAWLSTQRATSRPIFAPCSSAERKWIPW
jgi:hypothetical protein